MRRRAAAWWLAVASVLLAAFNTQAAPPQVTVVRSNGEEVSGTIVSWNAGAVALRTPAAAVQSIERSRIRCIRLTAPSGKAKAFLAVAQLANGDEIGADQLTIADDTLQVATAALGDCSIPLELVRSVRFYDSQGAAPAAAPPLPPSEGSASDVALLQNGDSIRGSIVSLNETDLVMETPLGEVRIPRSALEQLLMNPELLTPVEPAEQYWLLKLVDGSWLTSAQLQLEGDDRLTVKHVGHVEFAIPLAGLEVAAYYGGDVVSLADRRMAAAQGWSYFGEPTSVAVNRNVRGGLLRCGGETYLRGLGMTSSTQITYALQPGDLWFSSAVGIDAVTSGEGSVVFRVLVDGTTVWESGNVAGTDAVKSVEPIPLQGAQQLTLVVDFGARADIQDVANWCDPVIRRATEGSP